MTAIGPEVLSPEDPLARQGELLDEWVDAGARIGALEAERAELLAARLDLLAQARLDGDEIAFRSMCAEYAAAGHVSPATFASHITAAWMLVRTLPRTFAALAAGTITRRHADVIVAEAPNVSAHEDAARIRAEYEEGVVSFAQNDTAARTRTRAREVAAAVYPSGMAEQHKTARAERAVSVKPDGDGMAVLTAILPEVLAYAIHDRLTQMGNTLIQARPKGHRRPRRSTLAKIQAERDAALAQQVPSDPAPPTDLEDDFADRIIREFDETPPWESSSDGSGDHAGDARARIGTDSDSLADGSDIDDSGIAASDIATGPEELVYQDSTPMHDGYGTLEHDTRTLDQLRADLLADLLLTTAPSSSTDTDLASIRATVQVTIAATALANDGSDADDAMAELNGHGPMSSAIARILAGRATSWDRVFLDPGGMVVETDNYVPTAGMKRFLHARDQHCRFPGCRAPAHRCQIDHNHDHAKGGPTALSNLSLFCTSHHPLKHPDLDDRDRWTARQLDGGVILWTSPLGRTYTDEPPLRVMFA